MNSIPSLPRANETVDTELTELTVAREDYEAARARGLRCDPATALAHLDAISFGAARLRDAERTAKHAALDLVEEMLDLREKDRVDWAPATVWDEAIGYMAGIGYVFPDSAQHGYESNPYRSAASEPVDLADLTGRFTDLRLLPQVRGIETMQGDRTVVMVVTNINGSESTTTDHVIMSAAEARRVADQLRLAADRSERDA